MIDRLLTEPIKDICNSHDYDLNSKNLVSLVLYFDGASYTKSNSFPLHAFFSTICELPPLLRHSTRNIITHSLWLGSTPDFNVFMSRFNSQLDNILTKGIFIEALDLHITVKCHVFIADAPERPSVLNMNKFNGKYGCIHCVQEGENLNKGKQGNNFKYTYKPDEMFLRTNQKYENQVKQSIIQNSVFEGIKGQTYLSNWLLLPKCSIIDYMQASLLGTTKHMFNIFLSAKCRTKDYYLGSKLNDIDKLLVQIKYPSEFSRQQRSISHLQYFKASEYRNLIFYAALPILKYFLPSLYYNHFVDYVIFLRLLCDKNIDRNGILLAYELIDEYIKNFEILYGKENMTFNIHSHIHLPSQVQK